MVRDFIIGANRLYNFFRRLFGKKSAFNKYSVKTDSLDFRRLYNGQTDESRLQNSLDNSDFDFSRLWYGYIFTA